MSVLRSRIIVVLPVIATKTGNMAVQFFWSEVPPLVLHWSEDKAWLSGLVWPKPGQIIIWSGQIWSGRPYNLSGLAGYGQARPKKLSGQVICGLVRPNNYLVWSDLVSAYSWPYYLALSGT